MLLPSAFVAAVLFLTFVFFSASVVTHFRALTVLPSGLLREVEPRVPSGPWWWFGLAWSVSWSIGSQVAVIWILLTGVARTFPEAAFFLTEILLAFLWAAMIWRNSAPLDGGGSRPQPTPIPNTDHASDRLSGPMNLRIRTHFDARDAANRIQKTIEEQASVEAIADAWSARQIAGDLGNDQAYLRVRDANWRTRRKSWNIEFRGVLAEESKGGTLYGTIDIPGRRSLHTIMWLARGIGWVIAAMALGIAARAQAAGAPVELVPALVALVVGVGFTIGTVWMERDGERAAADDARLLARFLRMALEEEHPANPRPETNLRP